MVVFAHGSGSSRFSSRNRFVASELHKRRFATLLIDLLTHEEEQIDARTARLRFDIHLLAKRLIHAAEWLRANDDTRDLPIAFFGASTGAAAALVAAAELGSAISVIVSRGGRPDLAAEALERLIQPTLLIVGGEDQPVIRMNCTAMAKLRAETRLEIIPGATHLFEEPGALDRVANLAGDWIEQHL